MAGPDGPEQQSFVGETLGVERPNDWRDSLAATALAAADGARMFRVHEVAPHSARAGDGRVDPGNASADLPHGEDWR